VPAFASLVRADGRDADVVAFEQALVSFFIEAADMLGVPKSVAAIYGVCFAAPEPLSFGDIELRLDISRGSISQGLRVLREVGALKEVSGDADRRELFTPDLELRKLADHWIEHRLSKQLTSGRGRLQAITKSLPATRNGDSKVLRARLKALQTWHDKTRALLPIVKTFLKLT
jgi:DNA-binding transcriptional regulator GbsR (MarR family)